MLQGATEVAEAVKVTMGPKVPYFYFCTVPIFISLHRMHGVLSLPSSAEYDCKKDHTMVADFFVLTEKFYSLYSSQSFLCISLKTLNCSCLLKYTTASLM